jgi:hypothetical protein
VEPSDKPDMQNVVDFMALTSKLSGLSCDAAHPSLSALRDSVLGHGLVSAVQAAHATGNIAHAMQSFKEAICVSAFRIPASSADLAAMATRVTEGPLDQILEVVLDDVAKVRCLAKGVNFNAKPSARMASAPHERRLSVVMAFVSAVPSRPDDLFAGIWDDAVATDNVPKALELCSLQSSLTSLAVCLVRGHERCSGVVELVKDETKNFECANALRSVELISVALKQEAEAKQSFFPPGKQGDLNGYSRLCQLTLALHSRLRARFLSVVVDQCLGKADDLIKMCPHWTASITPTHLNVASAKRMLLDNDSVAQVPAGIRAYVLHRSATEDVFKLFGQDFATERPEVFENLLDTEVHARITCAVKSGINIIVNNSKNVKRASLIAELYKLVERQSKCFPKSKNGQEKHLELPASLQAALEKLKDDSSTASSKRSSTTASTRGDEGSASSSSAAPAAKRPKGREGV